MATDIEATRKVAVQEAFHRLLGVAYMATVDKTAAESVQGVTPPELSYNLARVLTVDRGLRTVLDQLFEQVIVEAIGEQPEEGTPPVAKTPALPVRDEPAVAAAPEPPAEAAPELEPVARTKTASFRSVFEEDDESPASSPRPAAEEAPAPEPKTPEETPEETAEPASEPEPETDAPAKEPVPEKVAAVSIEL